MSNSASDSLTPSNRRLTTKELAIVGALAFNHIPDTQVDQRSHNEELAFYSSDRANAPESV